MAKDPYKYFRVEAREILEGLGKGVLELERSNGSGKDVVGRLFRYAHTLKGAARVVKQPGLATDAHTIEDLLSPHRDADTPVPRESIQRLLHVIDGMTAALRALGTEDQPRLPEAPRPAIEEQLETVRVELREMDALLDDVSQLGAQLSGLATSDAWVTRAQRTASALLEQVSHRRASRNPAASLERAHAIAEELVQQLDQARQRLEQGRDHAESSLRTVRERAHVLRLLPASLIFDTLERAVRDAAASSGVRVAFVANGGDSRLDAHVLLPVRDALLHVVRNAVAHGIEPPDARARASKPATGAIELRVEKRGSLVAFVCKDDGRGIDPAALRQAAVDRGLVRSAEAATLAPQEVLDLVFLPGLSTSTEVTELSGRGVGLDVVRQTARRFKGDASATSEPGRGTAIEIRVPVSLSSLVALLVEINGEVHGIPVDNAVGALRVHKRDILRSGSNESIVYEERAVPFARLFELMGHESKSAASRDTWSAVVLRAEGRLAAIGVERILGTAELVIKPLPELAGRVPLVMGAALDADGHSQLLFDPSALVTAASARRERRSESVRVQRPPILVIDDSLTTRMLEQSILESAGYEVDIASSAEEALEKARGRRYGLFLCDVEMPGMDGYAFVTSTRADAKLSEVPVIMVTSLSSAEHRKRAIDAGASEYVVKGEFDQGRLLNHVRALMG